MDSSAASRIAQDVNGSLERLWTLDGEVDEETLRQAVSCVRAARNAASEAEHQQVIFSNIISASISALYRTTAFAAGDTYKLLTRATVQMLSNSITGNDALQDQLWQAVGLKLPAQAADAVEYRRDVEILRRLIASEDAGTRIATQVMLLNCIASDSAGAAERRHMLIQPQAGIAVLAALLNSAPSLEHAEEGTEDSLGVCYELFTKLFQERRFGSIYAALAPQSTGSDAPPVSEAQVTLLKLFDAFLHHGSKSYGTSVSDSRSSSEDCLILVGAFIKLATFAQDIMSAGGSNSADTTSAQAGVDEVQLMQAHTGLVLLLQCLTALALEDGQNEERRTHAMRVEAVRVAKEMRDEKSGFVEGTVALLHQTATFSPAVSPFKPIRTDGAPADAVLTSTGSASLSEARRPGLANLKRDIVRLLGVLAYLEPASAASSEPDALERRKVRAEEVKSVQDRVREKGGLFDVMNMTQLDEHNPYIREHAIFALRSLLAGNKGSQDLVAQLRPVTQ